MDSKLSTNATEVQNPAKARKPYHAPRIEDYGAVNELTRGGLNSGYPDEVPGYNSQNP